MALTPYTESTDIIINVGLNPEDRPDLNDDTFRAKFDANAANWKAFFNATTKAEIDALITAIKGSGWTSESLKGLADLISTNDGKLTTHKAEFTAHAELTSRIITVGTGKDFTTIQAALNSIKKCIAYGITVTINVDAGTYAEIVNISGFYGSGKLVINGASSIANTHKATNFVIIGCTCEIEQVGFYCTTTAVALEVRHSARVKLQYINSQESAASGFGIYALYSNVDALNCSFSNRNIALLASTNSKVYSESWTAGTGNTTGIKSENNASVGKNGTQPQGTTAETTANGGVIR